MANPKVFTDHNGKDVHTTDTVKVYRAPNGDTEWIGVKGMLMSQVVLNGYVMFSIEGRRPKSYSKRMAYFLPEYLEKV